MKACSARRRRGFLVPGLLWALCAGFAGGDPSSAGSEGAVAVREVRALREALADDPGNVAIRERLARLEAARPAVPDRAGPPGLSPDLRVVEPPVPTAADARKALPDRSLLERLEELPTLDPEVLPEPLREPARRIATLSAREQLSWTLSGLGIVALLLLLRRSLRGRGDLAVAIECPPERRGTFSVRLRRRRERRVRGDASGPLAYVPETRSSTRLEHNMVARETHFRGVPARNYWVVLEGALEAAEGEPSRPIYEEREVCIRRKRTLRVDFDLRPSACVLEVHVVRGKAPARDARVSLGGDPTSIRFAGGGIVRFPLPRGRHTLLVGADDRAAERSVRVESLEPRTLVVDLEDSSDLAFDDCPEAVDPFLRGDLSVVATALERVGQAERAHSVAARFHKERGNVDEAAEHFVAIGRLLEAAELRAGNGESDLAAELFERAGDLARAADLYDASGDLLRAGRAFEQIGDLDAAALRYRGAGATPRLLDVLEKQGEHFEAGEIARNEGDTSRAVRNFQHVGAKDTGYLRACQVLADHFHGEGKHELAVQKADEAMSFTRPEDTKPETLFWYGELLERAGRPDRALEVFEDLARRSPDEPNVTTRVEELRKKASAVRRRAGSSSAPTMAVAFGSERYDILEEIGAGGMGIVYKALDRRLAREVALKRLPDNLKENPRAVDLFLREARAAARLNHPNIVTVHDVDHEDGQYFITMELMVGTPLSDVVRARGRVTPLDTARLGVQVTSGLAYAHAQRIVHRDIKTANLFFTHDRVVKIMDFGLAKMLEEVRRASTVIGGTPYYMAPEQAAGRNVDHRADLYAFGATLFELLTGRPPFTEGDVAYHHRHTPPPDPRDLVAGLPDAMGSLVLDLLAKDPALRPESAAEVGRRLTAIADGLRR